MDHNAEHTLTKKYNLDGVDDIDTKKGVITGYASVFGNVDSDNDIIVKGSFAKSIKEKGPSGTGMVKHCWQHDMHQPIAITKELYEDSYGLKFVSQVPDDVINLPEMQLKLNMIRSGLVGFLSVGFQPVRADRKNGIRYLTENKLYEYSSVTYPANELAVIQSVKSEKDANVLMKSLSDQAAVVEAMTKEGTFTDEYYHLLEHYHATLLKHISDLLKAAPSEQDTQHDAPSEQDTRRDQVEADSIKSLIDLKHSLSWN